MPSFRTSCSGPSYHTLDLGVEELVVVEEVGDQGDQGAAQMVRVVVVVMVEGVGGPHDVDAEGVGLPHHNGPAYWAALAYFAHTCRNG